MATAGTVFLNVLPNMKGFHASIAAQTGARGALARSGVTAGGALAAGIGLGLAKSVGLSRDFETAFAGVRKTVDATEVEFAALETGIRKMSTQLPASTTEIAGVAEAAGQLGIRKQSILDFTRTMVDMGIATNLASDDVAVAFARIANVMQEPERNFDRMASAVVELGNKGAATESEIVHMAQNMVGAAKNIGISTVDVFSLSEALSSVGITAEVGSSSMARLFGEMSEAFEKGDENVKAFADVAGVSIEDFTKSFEKGGTPAVVDFVEGLGKMQKAGGPVIETLTNLGLGDIRVRRALTNIAGAGDLLATSLKTGTAAWKDNNALTEEARKRYKTFDSQSEKLKNQLKDLGVTVGNKLIPALTGVVKETSKILKGNGMLQGGLNDLFDGFRAQGEATSASSDIVAVFGRQLQAGTITLEEYRAKVGLQIKALIEQANAGDDAIGALAALKAIEANSLAIMALYRDGLAGITTNFQAADSAASNYGMTLREINQIPDERNRGFGGTPPSGGGGGGGNSGGGSGTSTTCIQLEMAGVSHEVTHQQKKHTILLGGRA